MCQKFATHCHFNPKLDTRRKVSYKSSEKHDIRGYILESTLQVLKRGKTECVESLLRIIRSDAPIEDIARSFQQNFKLLQNKGVIPPFKIDESDIISLALQGLFPYRVGCVQGDLDSDEETIHVPHSSPSQQNPQYCDYQSDPYAMRSAQKVQRFQDTIRRSPMSDVRTVNSNAIPTGSFNSTTYSSFSDDFSDFPPTPMSQSPQFYYDGVHGSQTHLTPYSSNNQNHAPGGHDGSYPTHVPVLVSQPILGKPHLAQNIQAMPNWQPNSLPLNTPGMTWHQNHQIPVTSTGMPVQLASHSEPVYWSST